MVEEEICQRQNIYMTVDSIFLDLKLDPLSHYLLLLRQTLNCSPLMCGEKKKHKQKRVTPKNPRFTDFNGQICDCIGTSTGFPTNGWNMIKTFFIYISQMASKSKR